MNNVINNKEWCNAIFHYCLNNPDFSEKIHIRGEYFDSLRESILSSRLYDSMKWYMDKYQLAFSLKTMELAYFNNVHTEFRDFYGSGSIDPSEQLALSSAKDLIKSTYDNIIFITNNLSEEFIRDIAVTFVKEQAIASSIYAEYEAYMTLQREVENVDEFFIRLNEKKAEIAEKYKLPEDNDEVHFINDFDNFFLVKIADKIYPTKSKHLNDYLSGGFHAQTVTGFLTKTGGGKSTLLFSLAADAMINHQNVCYVNLEMNHHEVFSNIISALTDRLYGDIESRLTDPYYVEGLKEQLKKLNLGQCGYYSNIGSDAICDIDTLNEKIKVMEKQKAEKTGNPNFKFDLIFIDYLYLMQPKRKMQKTARADELYRQLVIEVHKWAQEQEYAVVTVFQGNRTAESKLNNNESISLADAGDSYAAFRDLEYAFSVARYSDDTGRDGIKITPLKTRHYDGEWSSFYMPYQRGVRRYDVKNSQFITPEPEKADAVKITLSEVFDAYPQVKEIPTGKLMYLLSQSQCIVGLTRSNVKKEFLSRGWTLIGKYDVDDENGEMKEKIEKSGNELLSVIASLQAKAKAPKIIMTNDPNILFS